MLNCFFWKRFFFNITIFKINKNNISYFSLFKLNNLDRAIERSKYAKNKQSIIDKTHFDLKYAYIYSKFNDKAKDNPNFGFLKSSVEKSRIFCSKNSLFSTSLKGGREYFI